MATTRRKATGGPTRMDELRAMDPLLTYEDLGRIFEVKTDTARRWAFAGREARDKAIAEHHGVPLEDVRHWRRTNYRLWQERAAVVDLTGVGVGHRMLPERTTHKGVSDLWDRDTILAWGLTPFTADDRSDAPKRTRLNLNGTVNELIPTGRPPGVAEKTQRRETQGRAELRDAVVTLYREQVTRHLSDADARALVAKELGITRRNASRLLAEARGMADAYGEIPVGAAGRNSGETRRFRVARGDETRDDVVRKVAQHYAKMTKMGLPLERIKVEAGQLMGLSPKTIEKMVAEARKAPEKYGELPPPAGHRRRVAEAAPVERRKGITA